MIKKVSSGFGLYPYMAENFADGFDAVDATWHAGEKEYLKQAQHKEVHFFPVSENIFTSRDGSKEKFEAALAASVPSHPVHVGIAGIANMDMIYATRARAAVLMDVNPNQRVMWDRVIEIVRHNPKREEALKELRLLDTMMVMPADGDRQIKGLSASLRWNHGVDSTEVNFTDKELQSDFLLGLKRLGNNPESWLGSDERYGYIREMVLKNSLAVATVDALDPAQMKKLGKLIRAKATEFASTPAPVVFYTSNLVNFIRSDSDFLGRILDNPMASFIEGVESVIGNDGVAIVSHKVAAGKYFPPDILQFSELKERFSARQTR